jgi:hypothetical protein
MIDFKCLIGDLIYTKGNMQEFINRRFKSLDKAQIQFRHWDYAVMKNGLKFYVTEDFPCIEQVIEDYSFDDITKDTTVVDLGANIGGFSLQASLLAKRVIAYEPLRYKELERNIAFNGLTNIEVHHVGVGNGFNQEIRWGDMPMVSTVQLEDIVVSLEGVRDLFLKCDIEGFEKYMEPTDIATFDRVEMELHSWGDGPKVARNIIETLKLTHDVEVDQLGANGMVGILHARKK